MSAPPAFICSGGDILMGADRISHEDALWRVDLAREEYRLAFSAQDLPAARRALHLASNLAAVLAVRDQWARASGAA